MEYEEALYASRTTHVDPRWRERAPDDERIALMLDVARHARSESEIAACLERYATART